MFCDTPSALREDISSFIFFLFFLGGGEKLEELEPLRVSSD